METILKSVDWRKFNHWRNKFDPELHEAVMVRETEEEP
jgi:molecular chaperone GrpE (heat shock protein)